MTEQQIREAILDVIDGGNPRHRDLGTLRREWYLWSYQDETANQERLEFCDAVIAKLKTPSTLTPEAAAKLENATIGERFNHQHFEDVLRVQKQIG